MTKVLFLSALQIHPPLSGGNLRSLALAGALGRQGLDVFVYSMVGRKHDYLARRPSGTQSWPDGTQEYVDRGLLDFVAQYGSYALRLPPVWLTAYLRAAAASPGEAMLPRLLRERLRWCDAVVADFPFVYPIFHAPSARGRLHVLSTHNLEHQMHEGRGGARQRALRALVRRVELRAARACDILVSCCAGDQSFFEENARVRKSVLVPNGIEPDRFKGISSLREPTRAVLGLRPDERVFLFTGSKYGPNREAFEYLAAFARAHARGLAMERIHILVVGNVASEPVRGAGFTATGKVDAVEPYFAAADAALNPLSTGAGTNVKMCEFLATRLPILTTSFGARGFALEDGQTAFFFERDNLWPVLSRVRRLFDEDPARLQEVARAAHARNQRAIDMDTSVRGLREAMAALCDRDRDGTTVSIGRSQPASGSA